jgi:hypothetical protein
MDEGNKHNKSQELSLSARKRLIRQSKTVSETATRIYAPRHLAVAVASRSYPHRRPARPAIQRLAIPPYPPSDGGRCSFQTFPLAVTVSRLTASSAPSRLSTWQTRIAPSGLAARITGASVQDSLLRKHPASFPYSRPHPMKTMAGSHSQCDLWNPSLIYVQIFRRSGRFVRN